MARCRRKCHPERLGSIGQPITWDKLCGLEKTQVSPAHYKIIVSAPHPPFKQTCMLSRSWAVISHLAPEVVTLPHDTAAKKDSRDSLYCRAPPRDSAYLAGDTPQSPPKLSVSNALPNKRKAKDLWDIAAASNETSESLHPFLGTQTAQKPRATGLLSSLIEGRKTFITGGTKPVYPTNRQERERERDREPRG